MTEFRSIIYNTTFYLKKRNTLSHFNLCLIKDIQFHIKYLEEGSSSVLTLIIVSEENTLKFLKIVYEGGSVFHCLSRCRDIRFYCFALCVKGKFKFLVKR